MPDTALKPPPLTRRQWFTLLAIFGSIGLCFLIALIPIALVEWTASTHVFPSPNQSAEVTAEQALGIARQALALDGYSQDEWHPRYRTNENGRLEFWNSRKYEDGHIVIVMTNSATPRKVRAIRITAESGQLRVHSRDPI